MFWKVYQNRKRLKISDITYLHTGNPGHLESIGSAAVTDVCGFLPGLPSSCICQSLSSVLIWGQPSLTHRPCVGLGLQVTPWAPGPSIPNILPEHRIQARWKSREFTSHFCLIKGKDPVSFLLVWLVSLELLVTDSYDVGVVQLGGKSQRKPRQDTKRVWGLVMGLGAFLGLQLYYHRVFSQRIDLGTNVMEKKLWNKCRDTQIC